MTNTDDVPVVSAGFLADQLDLFISDCEAAVERGEAVILAGMETQVAALCTAIAGLPITEAQQFAGFLERFQTRLTRLEMQIKAEMTATRSDLDQVSVAQRAQRAYTNSGAQSAYTSSGAQFAAIPPATPSAANDESGES